jgi:cytochrome P450
VPVLLNTLYPLTSLYGATITEAIRLSYGVATRLARVAPDETLIYDGAFKDKPIHYTIPPGTPVSMTSVIMHADESIFPNADAFIPDRWLKEDGTRRTDLERFLMSFSKGSRQCIGIK